MKRKPKPQRIAETINSLVVANMMRREKVHTLYDGPAVSLDEMDELRRSIAVWERAEKRAADELRELGIPMPFNAYPGVSQ